MEGNVINLFNDKNVFWSLAKKFDLIEALNSSSKNNGLDLSGTACALQAAKHGAENAFVLMQKLSALKEKRRKLELEKLTGYHRSSNSSCINRMFDDGVTVMEKLKIQLDFILHKRHILLYLLQTTPKKTSSIQIPIHLQRTFIDLLENLVEVVHLKAKLNNCVNRISEWNKTLQEMVPVKQALRNISVFNRLLYDVCDLQNSVDEIVINMITLITSASADKGTMTV